MGILACLHHARGTAASLIVSLHFTKSSIAIHNKPSEKLRVPSASTTVLQVAGQHRIHQSSNNQATMITYEQATIIKLEKCLTILKIYERISNSLILVSDPLVNV